MDAVSGRERCTVVRWEDGRLFGWLLGWLGCSNGPVGHGGYRGTVTERVGAGDRVFDGGVHRAAALAERELPRTQHVGDERLVRSSRSIVYVGKDRP